MSNCSPALLALEDGTLWPGSAFGARRDATGEIVFNTSLTGYQEILTDPSYHGQLVTLTATHIGNTGINGEDDESGRVWAAALVVRDLSPVVSNWRATRDLDGWLREHDVPGITGVETRALVRHIREHGAMRAALSTADPDPVRLVAAGSRRARHERASTSRAKSPAHAPYAWNDTGGRHVVAYDFGIKRNILRMLAARGCRVTVVPAHTPAREVLALAPDGVFLSNGPGDPAAVTYAIGAVRELLGKVPIFGICLGHQILALALGARTYKLKFGHRGGNQPVRAPRRRTRGDLGAQPRLRGGRHEPAGPRRGHPGEPQRRLLRGIAAPALRAFAVQYHPESAPGPHDSAHHFDAFLAMMTAARQEAGHA